jgi:hypothetical protein
MFEGEELLSLGNCLRRRNRAMSRFSTRSAAQVGDTQLVS